MVYQVMARSNLSFCGSQNSGGLFPPVLMSYPGNNRSHVFLYCIHPIQVCSDSKRTANNEHRLMKLDLDRREQAAQEQTSETLRALVNY